MANFMDNTTRRMVAAFQARRFCVDDRGANLVEYAILIAFIAAVAVAALTFLGERTSDQFEPLTTTL